MNVEDSFGYKTILQWFQSKKIEPFAFQIEAWQRIHNYESGLINAPTGCGKTFSVFMGVLIKYINENPHQYHHKKKNGLQLLWISPLRALAKDIARAMEEALNELSIPWKVGIRSGDTPTKTRAQQKMQMPEILIITPESLHLLLCQKNYSNHFLHLKTIAVDEWHELLGSKRGVQVELALSRLLHLFPEKKMNVWGISATIGNLQEAKDVLLSCILHSKKILKQRTSIVRAHISKPIEIKSIFPDTIETYPWAGHLGIKLIKKIIPIILESRTTLVFINTRGMTENWYQSLLNECPELAGTIALHHGSIDKELRLWVEENLHTGKLKVVVCTASLDLGVDFRPVETVIQVGSPKGVARFLQRAGRSGHQPGEISKIYFLPTHSLELVEAAALKNAVEENFIESREPLLLCFDVLIQYLCSLAVSDGFVPEKIWEEVTATYCFREMEKQEWQNILYFITGGGAALQQYDEFQKVIWLDGAYRITNRRIAMMHRMNIGTIVSDAMLKVKFISGKYIGVIEEYFVAKMQAGDVFTLAGMQLEFIQIKDMTVLVKKSNAKKSMIPSWQGGRMPLSSNLGKKLRSALSSATKQQILSEELIALKPLFDLQKNLSHLPKENEFLIEQIETKEGYHLFVYPFEGRLVHEAMAAILAYRISRIQPISFSFAMNDYGFELFCDQPIPLDDSNVYELFSENDLVNDIQRSVNSSEMAKRKFRDIAVIGGLIFQGYPGDQKKARHLQSSASLLFSVFSEYDANNLLLRQAYSEVFNQQMEEIRLREMLRRIQQSNIIITFPQQLTPFCFPIKVDSMRENISSEKLEDRIRKLIG